MKLQSIIFLCCILFVACGKHKPMPATLHKMNGQDTMNILSAKAQLFTKNLNRSREWKGYQYFESAAVDSTYYYSDTTIMVNVLNDTTVKFFDSTFNLITSDYRGYGPVTFVNRLDVLIFVDKKYNYGHSKKIIEYYFEKDSIVYFSATGGLGATIQTIYHTK